MQTLISTILIGLPDNTVKTSEEYTKNIPLIKNLYEQSWRWHGTGKYHYRGENVTDVLIEIIKKGGLVPHKDPLDYTRGDVYTVSLSPSRTYSALYAQIHYEKGKRFRNPLQTASGAFYYVSNIAFLGLIHDRRLFSKKFRDLNRLNYEGMSFFRNKYTKNPLSLKDYINGGVSDIKNNYPVLIGIKNGAFKEANMAKVYSSHESRSETPIPISNFTHIEVPEENVSEVKKLLSKYNVDLRIIPIEWGEEFCKTLPTSFLKDGVPLK